MALRNDYEITEKASQRELYRFYVGDGSWFDYKYTSQNTDYIDVHDAGNPVYVSANIKRTKMKQTVTSLPSSIELEVSKDNPVAQAFVSLPPHGSINIDMSVAYDEDQGAITDPENLVFWKGKVINVKFEGVRAVLICENKFKFLDQLALRRRVTVHCPFALYSNECTVSKAGSVRNGVVTSITDPVNIIVDEDQNGGLFGVGDITTIYDYANHYNGGFLFYEDQSSGVISRVGIQSSSYLGAGTGTVSSIGLTLDQPVVGLVTGSVLGLYAGCARTVEHCHNKFNNYANFGGVPHLTFDDPFSTVFRTPLN